PEARARAARAPGNGAHLRREPHDARAVRRAAAARGARPRGRRAPHAAGRRRRRAARHRFEDETRVAALRVRARRARLRVQGEASDRGVTMSWNRVAVVGAGLIKMGELFEQSYEQMAAGAFSAAVGSVDKGFEPELVEAAFVATQRGTLWGQE